MKMFPIQPFWDLCVSGSQADRPESLGGELKPSASLNISAYFGVTALDQNRHNCDLLLLYTKQGFRIN